MKRLIYIIICLLLIVGCNINIKSEQNNHNISEAIKEFTLEQIEIPTEEPTIEYTNTLEPTATPEPTPEATEVPVTPEPIKYDELFDFSDWEEGLNEANNKEKYIEEYWKLKSNEVFYNIELYKLLKTDEQAKNAFLKEIKKQMTAQIINYLESSKIIITDEMKIYIDDMIDQQIKNLDEVIH